MNVRWLAFFKLNRFIRNNHTGIDRGNIRILMETSSRLMFRIES